MAAGSGAPGPRQSGSAELGIGGSRKTAPACDPHVPASFRRWALRQRPCLDPRGTLVALTPGGSSHGARPSAVCCGLLAAVWEIACQLHEITALRALLAANTPGTSAGPMTTDILRAQQRAIEVAQEAITSRILALEQYARQVIAAEEADRDWQLATTLSQLNGKYMDLVARTASDDYATGEIADLTEQLAAAARVRNGRLRDADLAASALVLPQTRSRLPQPRAERPLEISPAEAVR